MRNGSASLWPEGYRAAAFFSYDFDAESVWLNLDRRNASLPVTLSQARYGGKVGVFEILRVLRKHEVRATFFVPTTTGERYPDALKAIVDEGHEVGLHGEEHEPPHTLDPRQEGEILDRTIETLEKMTGTRPVGYRAPWVEVSEVTTELLADRGLLYDASFMDDVFPYAHELKDGAQLIELPTHWATDDWSYSLVAFNALPQPEVNVVRPASEMCEIWSDVRDGILEMGGLFSPVSHPQVSGRPNRIGVVDRIIQNTKETGQFWIANGMEIARWWKDSQAAPPSGKDRLNRH